MLARSSQYSPTSHRLTYAALLVLLLGAGIAVPGEALADAGKRGGGKGGEAMSWGQTNPNIRGGEGGGLEAVSPGAAIGAGGDATRDAGTGGHAPVTQPARAVITVNTWGRNGSCLAPCAGSRPVPDASGGGGGVAVLGGENIDLTVAAGISVTGGAGAKGTEGQITADHAIVRNGGGGGGGVGIAALSGTLTLNGSVNGGEGGASSGHPGAGGSAVVLTRGDIVVNAQITGGKGGGRLFDGSPTTASGDGGDGISIGSGTVLNNNFVLGGLPGGQEVPAHASPGARGIALRAGHDTIVTHKGSFNSSGSTAVLFEGDDNSLTMWSGSDIIGGVRFAGRRNQLALGSDNNAPVRVWTWGGDGFDFGTDGIYVVRVTPRAADRVDVEKGVRLNGAAVRVNAMASDRYAENTRYTIFHAGGTFNGSRFGAVTSNLAYLTPSLSYSADDTDAILTIVRKAAQPSPVPPVPDPVPSPTPDPVAPPVPDPLPSPTPDPVVPPAQDPVVPSDPAPVPPVSDTDEPATPIRFSDLTVGRNAMAVANAIDGLPVGHDLYVHALNLPEGAPQAFFSALSGEQHASIRNALQGLSAPARALPLAHLHANLSARPRAGAPTAAVDVTDAAPLASALPGNEVRPAWAEVVGSWQNQGGAGDAAAVRVHSGGVFVGADLPVGAGWRLGGALGYTDSRLLASGLAGRSDIASYSAAIYGGRAIAVDRGTFNLMLGVSHTWHDINTRRNIAVGGLDQVLRADYRAATTQGFAELGYAWDAGRALTLEPYAGLAWAGQRAGGFQEAGGSAALSGARQAAHTTTSTLGLRARQALPSARFQGALSMALSWRRAFGALRPTSTLAFDAGEAFRVAGAPIARDAAMIEAGLHAGVGRNASASLHYAGEFGAGNRNHSAILAWRWAF